MAMAMAMNTATCFL